MNPHIHKIIIFALITFFIVSWTSFLHHSGFWSFNQSQTGNPDLFANNSILNSTLGVCFIPCAFIYPLLTSSNSSKKSLPLHFLAEATAFCLSSMPLTLPTYPSQSSTLYETSRYRRNPGPRRGEKNTNPES